MTEKNKIKFRNNPEYRNFLMVLFFAAFFIIVADLSSELAQQKDEISLLIGIFEECDSYKIQHGDLLIKAEKKLLFKISPERFIPQENFSNKSVNDRGPPAVSL